MFWYVQDLQPRNWLDPNVDDNKMQVKLISRLQSVFFLCSWIQSHVFDDVFIIILWPGKSEHQINPVKHKSRLLPASAVETSASDEMFKEFIWTNISVTHVGSRLLPEGLRGNPPCWSEVPKISARTIGPMACTFKCISCDTCFFQMQWHVATETTCKLRLVERRQAGSSHFDQIDAVDVLAVGVGLFL